MNTTTKVTTITKVTLLLLCSTVIVLIGLALSFEFLAEELAKVYVVPMLVGAGSTQLLLLAVIVANLKSFASS